jgi:hypothetical protein
LGEDDVLVLLTQNTNENALPANRNINTAQTTTQAFTNGCIEPVDPNKIIKTQTPNPPNNLLHAQSSKENEHQASDIKSHEIYQFTNSEWIFFIKSANKNLI